MHGDESTNSVGSGDVGLHRPITTLTHLLRDVPPGRLGLLMALMIAGAGTEGLGLFTLVPMLTMMDAGGGTGVLAGTQFWARPFGVTPTLPGLLALFLSLVLLRGIIQLSLGKAQVAEQHALVNRLSRRCFDALIHAEWRWLAETHSADHRATLLTGAASAGTGLAFVMTMASGLVLAAVTLTVALVLSWQTTLAAIALGGLIILSLTRIRRRATAQGEAVWIAQRDLHRHVQRSLSALRLTKLFENEAVEAQAFAGALAEVRDAKMAHLRDGLWTQLLFQCSGALLLVLVIGLGVGLWGLTLAVILPLVLAIARVIPLLTGLHAAWHGWLNAAPTIAQVQALSDEAGQHAEPRGGDAVPVTLTRDIVLDGVSLRYPGRTACAIDAISCTIKARSTTAITGASGAGKSSFADLVMGLIELDSGMIKVDGVQLTGAARMRWRRSVAYVQQDPLLFPASIRDNLLWSRADASDVELAAALQMAAADFVLRLPDGLDTMVGDNGVRLSGGERQRLCLARALLRQPSLLILDEATSALDSESEAAIRTAVRNLHGRITCILIGHRSALLDDADHVIELHEGKLIAARAQTQAALP